VRVGTLRNKSAEWLTSFPISATGWFTATTAKRIAGYAGTWNTTPKRAMRITNGPAAHKSLSFVAPHKPSLYDKMLVNGFFHRQPLRTFTHLQGHGIKGKQRERSSSVNLCRSADKDRHIRVFPKSLVLDFTPCTFEIEHEPKHLSDSSLYGTRSST
jgi:hypothetical protein